MIVISLIYVVFVIFSIIYGKCNGSSSFQCGLCKSNTQSLKGLLSISIVLSHLTGNTFQHIPFFSFSAMGPIGVGCFFFLSGYGLVKASDKNGYFNGYFKKHVIKLFVPYLIMFIFWVTIFQVFLKESFYTLANSFASGNPVSNSWYVFAALYCYIIYWLAYKSKKSTSIYFVVIFLLIWIVVYAFVLKWPDWWYKTICNFPIGIIWAENENRLNRIIYSRYYLLSVISLVMLMFSYMIPHFFGGIIAGNTLWLINDTAMGIAGALSLGILIQKLSVINHITRFLGSISYEIYLIHGLVIAIFNFFTGGIKELNIYYQELASLEIIILTIIFATVAHFLSNRIIKILE